MPLSPCSRWAAPLLRWMSPLNRGLSRKPSGSFGDAGAQVTHRGRQTCPNSRRVTNPLQVCDAQRGSVRQVACGSQPLCRNGGPACFGSCGRIACDLGIRNPGRVLLFPPKRNAAREAKLYRRCGGGALTSSTVMVVSEATSMARSRRARSSSNVSASRRTRVA